MQRKEPNLYQRGEIWHVKIEFRGNRIHESTGESTLSAAREYRERARTKLKQIANGIITDKTYDDVMYEFLMACEHKLKPRAFQRYKTSAKSIHVYFTGKKLSDISRGVITQCFDTRRREVTGSTVNRDRALVSAMFTFAIDREYTSVNPVLAVKKMKEGDPRTVNLTRPEFNLIKQSCGTLLADMAEFDVLTGLRAQEIIMLKWPDVDLHKQQIELKETKSGRSRIVPLPDRAVDILSLQIRHITSPLVFHHANGKPYSHANRAFGIVAKRVAARLEAKAKTPQDKQEAQKLKDVTFHDLRTTYTCWNYSRGVPLSVLSKLLGHSSYTTTEKHYAFLQTEDLHNSIRGVANSLHTQRIPDAYLSEIAAKRIDI